VVHHRLPDGRSEQVRHVRGARSRLAQNGWARDDG
jgi:hypothetical protein